MPDNIVAVAIQDVPTDRDIDVRFPVGRRFVSMDFMAG